MISDKGWFSDLQKEEICEHVSREEYGEEPLIRTETQNIENYENPTQIETQNTGNKPPQ